MKFLCSQMAVNILSFPKGYVYVHHYERQSKRASEARKSGLQEEDKFRF